MKKLFLTLGIILSLSCQSFAGEYLKVSKLLDKIPPMKQGIAYSIIDSKFNYLSTLQIANWKNFSLEVGYAGRAKNTGDKAVVVTSYNIAKLKDFGVTLPILDLVEFNLGIYAGFGRITLNEGLKEGNNEIDYGISLTLLNIKW